MSHLRGRSLARDTRKMEHSRRDTQCGPGTPRRSRNRSQRREPRGSAVSQAAGSPLGRWRPGEGAFAGNGGVSGAHA